jgi:hypothetical protein
MYFVEFLSFLCQKENGKDGTKMFISIVSHPFVSQSSSKHARKYTRTRTRMNAKIKWRMTGRNKFGDQSKCFSDLCLELK